MSCVVPCHSLKGLSKGISVLCFLLITGISYSLMAIRLETFEGNHQAINFYKKNGRSVTGKQEDKARRKSEKKKRIYLFTTPYNLPI